VIQLRAYPLHIQAAESAAAIIESGIVASVFHTMSSRGEFVPGFNMGSGIGGTFWVCIADSKLKAEATAILDRFDADPEAFDFAEDWPDEGLLQALELTCRACQHDLRGLPGAGVCPECGKAFDKRKMVDRLLGMEPGEA
jgi:hypothetical protein